jgi:hypothetical protein
LFILRTAVGTQTCDPLCICDANGAGGTTATDALLCLKAAVAEPVTLACPCETIGEASLAFAVNPNPVLPGEVIDVRLTVTNTGITDLTSVQVDLVLPQRLDEFSLLPRVPRRVRRYGDGADVRAGGDGALVAEARPGTSPYSAFRRR